MVDTSEQFPPAEDEYAPAYGSAVAPGRKGPPDVNELTSSASCSGKVVAMAAVAV
jgi:hypothetical protein